MRLQNSRHNFWLQATSLFLSAVFLLSSSQGVARPPEQFTPGNLCRALFEQVLNNPKVRAELAEYKELDLEAEGRDYLWEQIHQTILSAYPMKNSFRPDKPYRRLVISSYHEGATVHTTAGRSSDTSVILFLPPRGAPTVWAALDPKERKRVVEGLTESFAKGRYDITLLNDGPGSIESPLEAQDRLVDKHVNAILAGKVPEEKLEQPFDVGISPGRHLVQSEQQCLAGVCRHSSASLVGILGELGIPQAEIRLVSGRAVPDAKIRHIWTEVLDVETNQWIEYDPTAQGDPNKKPDFGLNSLFSKRSPRTLREQYPHDQKVYSDFLTPQ